MNLQEVEASDASLPQRVEIWSALLRRLADPLQVSIELVRDLKRTDGASNTWQSMSALAGAEHWLELSREEVGDELLASIIVESVHAESWFGDIQIVSANDGGRSGYIVVL